MKKSKGMKIMTIIILVIMLIALVFGSAITLLGS